MTCLNVWKMTTTGFWGQKSRHGLDRMNPSVKSCSVLLKRNFAVSETTNKINYSPTVEMEKIGKASFRSEKIDSVITPPKVIQEKNKKLREKGSVNYSDVISSEEVSSCSDFTNDSSSSDGEETAQEQKSKKIIYSLSKSNPKKLCCSLCEESFSNHSSYLIHQRFHEFRPFKCALCNKSFEHRQSFISHMKRQHPEIKPFLCKYPHCDKSFETKKQQEMHHKMHWKYMCKYCKKLFLRKHQMRKHVMKIH